MDQIIMPEISVIMPVYNCEAFIRESVESILNQSFNDFEFIIIDDASTDKTVEIIQSYKDHRIRLILKPVNSGYTDSLNIAINLSKGRYIARMDADDIAVPTRLDVQRRFLEEHTDTLVVGAHYQIVGTNTVIKMPVSFEAVKVTALMHVPVAHPTAFLRKEVFTKHHLFYDKNFEPAEDYDLWCRILEKGKIENIDEVLLFYRHHDLQESKIKHQRIIEVAVSTRASQLKKLIDFDGKGYDLVFAINVLTKNISSISKRELFQIRSLLLALYRNNKHRKVYDQLLLLEYLNEKWNYYFKQYNFSKPTDILMLLSLKNYPVTKTSMKFRMGRLLKICRFK